VIFAEIGLEGLTGFIHRFVFNALIGNAENHLQASANAFPMGIPLKSQAPSIS
jgi:hypothetical protein